MFRRFVKLVVINLVLISLFVPFQNCSPKFKSQVDTLESQSSLSSDLSGSPVISFLNVPEYYTTAQVSIQFSIGISPQTSPVAKISCQVNDQTAESCAVGTYVISQISDGNHQLRVLVENVLGEKFEKVLFFKKDSALPQVNVSSTPPAIYNLTTATFVFNAVDAFSGLRGTECSLDNAVFSNCVSPLSLSGLSINSHNLRIRATDRAGLVSVVYSYNWQINTSVPVVMITSTPLAVTNLTQAQFQFSGAQIQRYECSLNAVAFTICQSPQNLTSVPAGRNTFSVRGVSASNVTSAATQYSWTIDTAAPQLPTIMHSQGAVTTEKNISLAFNSTDVLSGVAGYQCSLDTQAFATCTSPRAFTNLSDGAHNFRVQAVDQAGNLSAVAQTNWTIQPVIIPPPPPPPPTGGSIASAKIFISGHSLTDNPLPDYMQLIARSLSTSLDWNQQNVLGSPIRYRTRGASNTDPTFSGYNLGKNKSGSDMNILAELRNPQTINGGRYDTLIIAENHNLLSALQWEATVKYTRHFHERVIENNSLAKTFFYETWYDVNKANPLPWITHERTASVGWKCIANRINHSLAAEGRVDRITSLPTGAALTVLVERALSTQGLPGITGASTTETLNRIFSDNVHVTPLGAYYLSLVTYSAVYRRSPVGTPPPTGITTVQASELQRLAWDYITQYYANQTTMSLAQCQQFFRDQLCAVYWNYRSSPQEISSCQSHFMQQNTNNPLYYDSANDRNYWFPAPPR